MKKQLALVFAAILLFAAHTRAADIHQIKESTYLCANSLRYFDGVAVSEYRVITGIAAIPPKYQHDRITLYGLNGVVNYGKIVSVQHGIAAIETEQPLPRWVNISSQMPVRGEPIMCISAKWAFTRGYWQRGLVGHGFGEVLGHWQNSNDFATSLIANTGAGVYDVNLNLIGLCWGYGPDYGIALAFGVFH